MRRQPPGEGQRGCVGKRLWGWLSLLGLVDGVLDGLEGCQQPQLSLVLLLLHNAAQRSGSEEFIFFLFWCVQVVLVSHWSSGSAVMSSFALGRSLNALYSA